MQLANITIKLREHIETPDVVSWTGTWLVKRRIVREGGDNSLLLVVSRLKEYTFD